MKQLHLDALRDIAIEYIPKAKLIQANVGASRDHHSWELLTTAFMVKLAATAPAKEQAAAILLNHLMVLSVILDDNQQLTKSERRFTENAAIDAAYVLFQLDERSPPAWLPPPSIHEGEDMPDEPDAPKEPVLTQYHSTKPAPQPGTMLTTAQAAEYLKVQPQTLRSWKSQGKGPPGLRVVEGGRRNKYHADDVLKIMRDGW